MKKTSKKSAASEQPKFRVVTDDKPRRMDLGNIEVSESDIVKVWRKSYNRADGQITVTVVYTVAGEKRIYESFDNGSTYALRAVESCVLERIVSN